MPNVLEKIIDYLIAVVLMFIIPICYFAIKMDSVIQVNVDKETAQFVELVSTQGYLTVDMYKKYLQDLDDTGKLYTVKLIHEQNAFEPEYQIRAAGDVIDVDESLWTGLNEYNEEPIINEPPMVTDPVDNSGLVMNTETNESVLASAVNTPADAGHIHTAACYAGHTHTESCYVDAGNMGANLDVQGYGNITYTSFADENHTLVGTGRIWIRENWSTDIYSIWYNSSSRAPGNTYNTYSASIFGQTPVYVNGQWTIKNIWIDYWITDYVYHAGWKTYTSGYNTLYYTKNPVWESAFQGFKNFASNLAAHRVWTGGGYLCTPFEILGGYYFIGGNAPTPTRSLACDLVQVISCDKIVASITPTHPVQTVYTDNPLITTVIITYLNGSTATVVSTSSYSTAMPVKNMPVTLTYTTTVGGSTSIITCTISVTVIPKTKACVYGHVYNLNRDGSDPGCYLCKNLLRNLSVVYPTNSRLTLYRNINNNLVAEGVVLMAIYLDGHTEYVYSGYVDNLDPDYVGTQMVTIGYKGLTTTTLRVDILRNRKRCAVCGLYYNLLLDDQDPGCPYCRAKVPIFTGNVMTYCEAAYEDEIIKEMYEGTGTYYFRRGDNFKVQVSSRDKRSKLTAIGRLFHLNIRIVRTDTIKDEVIFK